MPPDQPPQEQTHSVTTQNTRSILPADMISVEEARERILAHFSPLDAVDVPLLEARGQVLAEDVRGGFDIPPLDNTAMDGYAVRATDTEGATYESPLSLRVTGYLAAGAVFDGEVGAGEAVRIMTGAPVPAGADAIVPFEETDEQDEAHAGTQWDQAPREQVRIDVAATAGANIRRAGEDIRASEVVLAAGTVLGPAQLGVLASLGLIAVKAVRRPRVTILSTGDELLRPGEPLAPGKIYDSNAFSLAAQVESYGAVPRVLDIAADTVEALTARIHEGVDGADLLVTSAGVSRGDFDVVKDVLEREGEIGFWTVCMKPGKPLAFGAFATGDGGSVPHLGLPGNPVSAMMTMELFGRAAIFTMLGKGESWQRPTVRAVAADRIRNSDGRRFYARAHVELEDGRYVARLTGPQGSGVLTSMALANGYAVCPEDVAAIEAGEECDVILVDREGPLPPPSTFTDGAGEWPDDGADIAVDLVTDGKPVDVWGFPLEMIARPVLTMVEMLKGVSAPQSVRLTIRRRPDSPDDRGGGDRERG
ncbi:MAG: molybdopterin molybdotransferase MoeA [Dehalococcoidia bacterium]|nr:molybdopterin molybdotransferase MoeA [Dehalococcoidia bacterium]